MEAKITSLRAITIANKIEKQQEEKQKAVSILFPYHRETNQKV